MRWSTEQQKRFQEEGFLLLPEYFSPVEVRLMKGELAALLNEDSPRRVVEKEGSMVRSVYGSHAHNEVFNRLSKHPRLVKPAAQLLGSDVYVYQFKINAKARFGGDRWDWHYDYVFWQKEDGLPSPRVTNVAVFLDDVTEFNGPMFLIPGSHKAQLAGQESREAVEEVFKYAPYQKGPMWIADLTADLKYSLDNQTVEDLVLKYGIVAPKGPAGSALFFDSTLVHASPNNISPFNRVTVVISYSSVNNVPTGGDNARPDFLVSRDHEPITPLSDDTLLRYIPGI
jgi:ectoine hydroxylase